MHPEIVNPHTLNIANEFRGSNRSDSAEATVDATRSHAQPASSGVTRNRLLRGGVWVLVLRVTGICLAVIVNAVLARVLTKEAFGNFIWFSSLLTVGGCASRLGMERLIPRFVAESVVRRDLLAYYGTFRKGSLLAMLCTLSLAAVWSIYLMAGGLGYLSLPRSGATVILTSLTIVTGSILMIAAESLRGLHRPFQASLFSADASGPLIACLLLLQVAMASTYGQIDFLGSLFMLLVSMAIPAFIATLLLMRAIRESAPIAATVAALDSGPIQNSPTMTGDQPTYRRLFSAGWPIMLTQLFAMICIFSDIWIAKICCNDEQLALMGASRRLVLMISMPMTIMNLAITGAIPTLYAERNLARLQAVLQRSALIGFIPSMIAVITLTVAPAFVLSVLYGAAYSNAGPLVSTMAIGIGILCWSGAAELLLVLTGQQRCSMTISVIAGIASPVVCYLVSNFDNAWTIALASSIVLAVRSLAMWWFAYQTIGVWTNPSLGFFRRTQENDFPPSPCESFRS